MISNVSFRTVYDIFELTGIESLSLNMIVLLPILDP